MTPGQQPLNLPLAPLPPLQTEGASLTDLNKRLPYGEQPPDSPDITNHKPEANKADSMCDKIDHSVNVLALNTTAHMLAANYYYTRYCVLAITSITISSIVAVWGRILPAEMVGVVSAICNASNTLLLGLMALMRFESKSMLHTQGACTLQSLKVKQIELRDKLQQIVHGFQHEDQHEAADTFWRSWSSTVESLNAKAQETMEMIEIHPQFVAQAQSEHEILFRAETQIPFMIVAGTDTKADALPSVSSPPASPPSPPASPPSPPSGSNRLPDSPESPLATPSKRQSTPGSSKGRGSRREASPAKSTMFKSQPKWQLANTSTAGIEYSLQKLDQLRARLRLILAQHLIASKYYMDRYYMLSFPSIAMSSFLTVIALIIPRLPGCDPAVDEDGLPLPTTTTADWPLMSCPSENLGSLLNGLNTICLGVMAILRHQTKADMHDNAAKNLQSLIVTVEFLKDEMTYFSQRVDDPTMVADGRTFFRGFYRRLGVVYAKVEEIQEMMPIHPNFQRKAVKVHMSLYLKEQSLMTLHKITPQDIARGPRKGADFSLPSSRLRRGTGGGAVSPIP